jgi:predicted acylesterase/phospholipase RssA
MSGPFKVLALDGGGIRGYYTAVLLEHLATRLAPAGRRADLGKGFSLIVGTSTGAILGAALAAGLPIDRVARLYRTRGPEIFPSPSPVDWTNLAWCVRHWRRPSARADALRAALAEVFGAETLGELYVRRGVALCVTATDLATLRTRIFRTPHGPDAGDAARTVVEVCLASSAAPIVLPPAAVPGATAPEVLCDGGLWANNPVLVALAEAERIAEPGREIQVLSVGTCPSAGREHGFERQPLKGIGFWIDGLRLMHASLDAQSLATAALAARLGPLLKRPTAIVRLRDPGLAPHEAERLRLDNAAPEALELMERLAAQAADANASNGVVAEVFRGLGELAEPQPRPSQVVTCGDAG